MFEVDWLISYGVIRVHSNILCALYNTVLLYLKMIVFLLKSYCSVMRYMTLFRYSYILWFLQRIRKVHSDVTTSVHCILRKKCTATKKRTLNSTNVIFSYWVLVMVSLNTKQSQKHFFNKFSSSRSSWIRIAAIKDRND